MHLFPALFGPETSSILDGALLGGVSLCILLDKCMEEHLDHR